MARPKFLPPAAAQEEVARTLKAADAARESVTVATEHVKDKAKVLDRAKATAEDAEGLRAALKQAKVDYGVELESAKIFAAYFQNAIKEKENGILNTQRQLQGQEAKVRACNKELTAAEAAATAARESLEAAERKLRAAEAAHRAAVKTVTVVKTPSPPKAAEESSARKKTVKKRERSASSSPEKKEDRSTRRRARSPSRHRSRSRDRRKGSSPPRRRRSRDARRQGTRTPPRRRTSRDARRRSVSPTRRRASPSPARRRSRERGREKTPERNRRKSVEGRARSPVTAKKDQDKERRKDKDKEKDKEKEMEKQAQAAKAKDKAKATDKKSAAVKSSEKPKAKPKAADKEPPRGAGQKAKDVPPSPATPGVPAQGLRVNGSADNAKGVERESSPEEAGKAEEPARSVAEAGGKVVKENGHPSPPAGGKVVGGKEDSADSPIDAKSSERNALETKRSGDESEGLPPTGPSVKSALGPEKEAADEEVREASPTGGTAAQHGDVGDSKAVVKSCGSRAAAEEATEPLPSPSPASSKGGREEDDRKSGEEVGNVASHGRAEVSPERSDDSAGRKLSEYAALSGSPAASVSSEETKRKGRSSKSSSSSGGRKSSSSARSESPMKSSSNSDGRPKKRKRAASKPPARRAGSVSPRRRRSSSRGRRRSTSRARHGAHSPPSRRSPVRRVDPLVANLQVTMALRELFQEGLKMAIRKNRMPFNISLINDKMRVLDRKWHCLRDLGTPFSTLCRKFEDEGLIRMRQEKDGYMLASCPRYKDQQGLDMGAGVVLGKRRRSYSRDRERDRMRERERERQRDAPRRGRTRTRTPPRRRRAAASPSGSAGADRWDMGGEAGADRWEMS